MQTRALLALADGSLFWGNALGARGQITGEVVFNTALTGYQEILTDPSYYRQLVTLTYPHIGNVGTNSGDSESEKVYASGLIIRDFPKRLSNWRNEQPLDAYLSAHQVIGISDIDTRKLTRHLRNSGAQNGCLMSGDGIDEQAAVFAAQNAENMAGLDLAKVVSTTTSYEWQQGTWRLETNSFSQITDPQYHVVAYDFGVKRNILRMLAEVGCRITVVPAQTPAKQVLDRAPTGVFLSNGPGDPEPCQYAIDATQIILNAKIPLFGICLGHQILGLASGAKTRKMKFGHHGANHPVQDLATRRVFITSQNHGFAVDEATLPDHLHATHRSLFDGSLQGIRRTDCPAFSFQGHPEASPGPHDIGPLFQQFAALMADYRLSK